MKRQAFTLTELLVAIAIIGILLALLLAAVQKVRSAAAKSDCQNRMRQIGIALHQYHDINHRLPTGLSLSFASGRLPTSGWPLHILPFIDQNQVFQQALNDYKTSPSVFAPPLHKGISTVVSGYICPADPRIRTKQFSARDQLEVAFTSYLGVCGTDCVNRKDGVLYSDSITSFADITDGISQTLQIGERPPSSDFHFGWWYAGFGQILGDGRATGSAEMILGVQEQNLELITPESPCGPGVYTFRAAKNFADPCGAYHFWSPHNGGSNFLMCDGSIRLISYSAVNVLTPLSTRSGGESDNISD